MGEGGWGCGGLGKRAKVSHFALVWPQRDLLHAANLRLRNQQTETSACVKAQRRTRAPCCGSCTNYSMDVVIHLKKMMKYIFARVMHVKFSLTHGLAGSQSKWKGENLFATHNQMSDSPLDSKHLISRCININLENIRFFKILLPGQLNYSWELYVEVYFRF